MGKIQNIKPEVKEAIKRKSAFVLPNNPGGAGYKPEDIRKALYKPILDATNSALAEIDRVIDEANILLSGQLGSIDIIDGEADESGYYQGSEGFYYMMDEDGGFILCGSRSDVSGVLTVPSSVRYGDAVYPVYAIDDFAFENSAITELEIAATIEMVGEGAFFGCNSLSAVRLFGLTEIGAEAFPTAQATFTVPYEHLEHYTEALEEYAKGEVLAFDNADDIARKAMDAATQALDISNGVSDMFPAITEKENGCFLRAVNGKWVAVEVPYAEGVSV